MFLVISNQNLSKDFKLDPIAVQILPYLLRIYKTSHSEIWSNKRLLVGAKTYLQVPSFE
jgi:hypothetical protein